MSENFGSFKNIFSEKNRFFFLGENSIAIVTILGKEDTFWVVICIEYKIHAQKNTFNTIFEYYSREKVILHAPFEILMSGVLLLKYLGMNIKLIWPIIFSV